MNQTYQDLEVKNNSGMSELIEAYEAYIQQLENENNYFNKQPIVKPRTLMEEKFIEEYRIRIQNAKENLRKSDGA